jgi:hypothetical protein
MKAFCLTTMIVVFLLLCTNGIQAQSTQNKQRERGSVVIDLPRMNDVIIKKDIPYQDIVDSTLKMDIYYPPDFDFQRKIPAIIFISGAPDSSMVKLVGNPFRKFNQYTSWCKLVAASGMAAIVYETIDPKNDLISLTEYINSERVNLSIDKNKLGSFVCSGHTPTAAYHILSASSIFRCGVLYYGFFLPQDFLNISTIESMFKQRGFQKPSALPDPAVWKKDVPLLIVRAGMDETPYLNQSMKSFVNHAINQNLPITVINYANGVHGFDVYTDNETSREIIKKTLEFWKFYLKQ